MERLADKFQGKVDRLVARQRGLASGITQNVKISEQFGFNDAEMELFNTSFARYWTDKTRPSQGQESFWGIVGRQFTFLAPFIGGWVESAEVMKATVDALKLEERSLGESLEGYFAANSIMRAANRLSTIYLGCQRDGTRFADAVANNESLIKDILEVRAQ